MHTCSDYLDMIWFTGYITHTTNEYLYEMHTCSDYLDMIWRLRDFLGR